MFWKNLNDCAGAREVSICYTSGDGTCSLMSADICQTYHVALFVTFSKVDIGWSPF